MAGCRAVPLAPPDTVAAPAAMPAVAAVPTPTTVVPVLIPEPAAPVLAYADRIRNLAGPELAQEIARLNDTAAPADQLRLAIALVQTRQLYDLARAQDLLQKVLANNEAEVQKLHPLARLLAARYAEQRRAEDLLDRQGQQLRDTQRRLEQTNEKLEALKEIERSLTSRPAGAAAPAPSAAAQPRNRASRPAAP